MTATASSPSTPGRPLAGRYPALVCDLDGVVYRGASAVPHAVDGLAAAVDAGSGVVFATNNASRTPADVAAQLRALGVRLDDEQVLTSSLAGASWLAERLTPGDHVLVVGGRGVPEAVRAVGLEPVTPETMRQQRAAGSDGADTGGADTGVNIEVKAVLQGYGPAVTAADLGEAAYAIQAGARWVATNDDLTLPTDRGVAPGNGSLVRAVRLAVEVDPEVVGKPGPLMYELAAKALGQDAAHTLGIGDRLETDVAGAHAAGMDALHVLTGVHGPADLVSAPATLRPRYVAADLRALSLPYDEPRALGDGAWAIRECTATLAFDGANPRVAFSGTPDQGAEADGADAENDEGDIERLRLALRVLWTAIDEGHITAEQAVAALPGRS
ncbi:HAD-IIA family hydrolase [Flexivirga meconopsidis]|uniref:HAD-IIA family hydrolase n=1 Tax=Flexivirga meconopsidis TaxID=2977121 RepID=UPI00223EC1D2